ncbi:MAG: EAL domain-containing protein [Gammaproteobacteria bacterium]|nr:EAL domain-containing protein [Gammaproteobacteria bacterium]
MTPSAPIEEVTVPVILVVDDDEMLCVLTRAELENSGFTVIDTHTAADLLARLDAWQPDLILLDVMMPDIDGFQACASLREAAQWRHIPIMMMTGLDDVGSINRAYEVGATDFITKPINFDLLSHRVRYLLRAKATADALRASEQRLAQAQRIAKLGHWETDTTGNFTIWTPEVQRLFGLNENIHVNDYRTLGAAINTRQRDAISAAFEQSLDDGSSFNLEICVGDPARDGRILDLVGIADRNSAGECRLIGTVQDVTERRSFEHQLHQLEHYDGVTGLPNRASIHQQLKQLLQAGEQGGRPVAVLAVELNEFRRINDTLGFRHGNEVLRIVGQRLRDILQGGVTTQAELGRGNGGEFLVLLAIDDAVEHAGDIARKLRAALDAPLTVDEQEIFIRASVGISVSPADGNDADSLIRAANAAAGQARSEDDDTERYYTKTMNLRAVQRLTMEMNLRRALERDQFMVCFQPKLRGADLTIAGFEALLRWYHPDLKQVPPSKFIPIAEETGLIVPISEWVLARVAEQLRLWRDQGIGDFHCAVNLSSAQFKSPSLHQRLAGIVAANGTPATQIELEITESILMQDCDAAVRIINELKSHGFGIAIDDFGTGYSSLSYLQRLPLDVLKIDQAFVQDITGDRDDPVIVKTIISMARSLRLSVVAEGVETTAQMKFLRSHDCDELQGFLFGAAMPATDVADWLVNLDNRRAAGFELNLKQTDSATRHSSTS